MVYIIVPNCALLPWGTIFHPMLDCSISEELEAGSLVEIFPNQNPPEKILHLIFHKNKQQIKRNQEFKDFVKNIYS